MIEPEGLVLPWLTTFFVRPRASRPPTQVRGRLYGSARQRCNREARLLTAAVIRLALINSSCTLDVCIVLVPGTYRTKYRGIMDVELAVIPVRLLSSLLLPAAAAAELSWYITISKLACHRYVHSSSTSLESSLVSRNLRAGQSIVIFCEINIC